MALVRVTTALLAVTRAREVERLSEGYVGMPVGKRRAKRQELIRATNARVLEALSAGASRAEIGQALGLTRGWTDTRIRNARAAAGEPPSRASPRKAAAPAAEDTQTVSEAGQAGPPEAEDVVYLKPPESLPIAGAPNVWLEVPRCGAMAPPGWPVSARCIESRGHPGDHRHGARG